jgi:hypothetical protein
VKTDKELDPLPVPGAGCGFYQVRAGAHLPRIGWTRGSIIRVHRTACEGTIPAACG